MTDLNALTLSDLYTELARQGFVRRLLELARDEDLGPPTPGRAPWRGDVTSTAGLASGADGTATLTARQGGVIAGLATIPELLEVFGVQARWIPAAADGWRVEAGTTLGRLSGPLSQVLAVERTLLNLVSRLSGVATRTASFVQAVAGIDVQLLDTRKTTPGLRVLEKYAVRCGGGFCHRMGLHDALLIKDNHLAGISPDRLAAFVKAAVERARAAAAQSGRELRFAEVEVDSLDQLARCWMPAARGRTSSCSTTCPPRCCGKRCTFATTRSARIARSLWRGAARYGPCLGRDRSRSHQRWRFDAPGGQHRCWIGCGVRK